MSICSLVCGLNGVIVVLHSVPVQSKGKLRAKQGTLRGVLQRGRSATQQQPLSCREQQSYGLPKDGSGTTPMLCASLHISPSSSPLVLPALTD